MAVANDYPDANEGQKPVEHVISIGIDAAEADENCAQHDLKSDQPVKHVVDKPQRLVAVLLFEMGSDGPSPSDKPREDDEHRQVVVECANNRHELLGNRSALAKLIDLVIFKTPPKQRLGRVLAQVTGR